MMVEEDSPHRSELSLDAYQSVALDTAGGPVHDLLACWALGVTGEAGEFADLIKKHLYHGHPLDREKIAQELGDVLWYVSVAARALGFNLSEIAEGNLSKLCRRYPDGFSAERSLHREDP